MTSRILVTFATKYGSTQGTAETIAKTLTDKNFAVDVMPSRDVTSLEEYQAIVIGTPLYAGSMLSDTTKFLNRHKDALETMPSALFVLGPLEGTSEEMRGVQAQLVTNRKKFPWFKPVATKVFVGALDLAKLRFPDSLIKLYRSTPQNPLRSKDGRDWKAIQAWADSLPETLNLKAN
jgi:menaquinone-dependent protoporphyrinogen oxidase